MNILAVDDSNDWRMFHKISLNDIYEDLNLVIASSASEGIEKYKEQKFDLVITDLQMEDLFEPLYAGEWLTKEIKELNQNQKILIVSSCYNIDKIAETYGANYLSKRNIIYDNDAYRLTLEKIL